MSDAVDSHYAYVKSRIQTLNSARVFGGIVDALDWPPDEVKLDVFYLVLLPEEIPIGAQGQSAAIPILHPQVQWQWMIGGTDLTDTTKGRNKGDRYRTHSRMRNEILHGLFPGFTEKKRITSVNTTTGAVTFESFVPRETVRWTRVSLRRTIDKDSGFIYGVGAITLTDMTDEIAA